MSVSSSNSEKCSQTEEVDDIKIHVLFSVASFKNRAIYDMRRKNIVEPDGPEMTIWRVRFACWVTKATNTYTQVV